MKSALSKTKQEQEKTTTMQLNNTIIDYLHGDILQFNIVSRLFAIDILPASLVSKAWREAVVSSLRRRRCRPPPSLVILFQRRYGLNNSTAFAFDPLSRSWHSVPVAPESKTVVSAAHTSRGARFYMMSGSKLSLSEDALGALWRDIKSPRYWRTEPLVAVVGQFVVVIGGVNEYEEAPMNAVEVLRSGESGNAIWESCEPMPEDFGWTGSVSVVASEQRIYVIEKQAPWSASWFDPKNKNWNSIHQLQLSENDSGVKFAAIGILNGRLIVVGASGIGSGDSFRPISVRFWAIDEETMQVKEEKKEWRMPADMVAGLVVEDDDYGWCEMRSIGFSTDGSFAYIYNPSQPREFFLCEFRCSENNDNNDECRWERVAPPAFFMEKFSMHRVIIGCSTVSVAASVSH